VQARHRPHRWYRHRHAPTHFAPAFDYVQRNEDDDFSDIQQKPHILWSLADDGLYPDLKRSLVAIHQNPAGASGSERNHKVGKRVHCRTRILLGQQKMEPGSAIAFNGKQLDRRIGITRDEPFTNWLSGLGQREHDVGGPNVDELDEEEE
jgi:hypothetical protein